MSSRRPPSSPTIRSRRRGLRERAGRSRLQRRRHRGRRRELERRTGATLDEPGRRARRRCVGASSANAEWQLHQAEQAAGALRGGVRRARARARRTRLRRRRGRARPAQFFMGDLESAQPTVDAALEAAERLWLPETLSQALNTAGLISAVRGRWEQGCALIKRALEMALENDLTTAALRALQQPAATCSTAGTGYEEAIEVQSAGLALARRVGATVERVAADRRDRRSCYSGSAGRTRRGRHSSGSPSRVGASVRAARLAIYLAAIEGDVAEARRLLDATDDRRGEDRGRSQDRIGLPAAGGDGLERRGPARARRSTRRSPSLERPADASTVEARLGGGARGRLRARPRRRSSGASLARIEAMPPGHLPPHVARATAIRFRALLGDEPDERFRVGRRGSSVSTDGSCMAATVRPSTPSGSSRRARARGSSRCSPRRAPSSSGRRQRRGSSAATRSVSASPSAPRRARSRSASRGRPARRRARSRPPSRSPDGSTSTTSAPASSSRDAASRQAQRRSAEVIPPGSGVPVPGAKPGRGRRRRRSGTRGRGRSARAPARATASIPSSQTSRM